MARHIPTSPRYHLISLSYPHARLVLFTLPYVPTQAIAATPLTQQGNANVQMVLVRRSTSLACRDGGLLLPFLDRESQSPSV